MLEHLSDCLWTDYQPMSVLGLPLGRRCAIARGSAGQWVLFSPLEASPAVLDALRRFGAFAAFVLPSRSHDRFYDGYFEVFRNTLFLADRGVIDDHPTWPLTEIAAGLPELEGFSFELIRGMPAVEELVFFHHRSKTLIIADAVFSVPIPDRWWTRLIMRAAEIGGKPRPSRLFKSLIRDRSAFSFSLKRILEFDFDRIVPGHGEIIASDARQVFRDAFQAFLD